MKAKYSKNFLLSIVMALFVFPAIALANQPPAVQNPIANKVKQINFPEFTAADLSTVFSDPDGDTLNYSAQSVDGNVSVYMSGALLRISSVSGFTGVSTVEATADDGNGGSITDEFFVTVNVRLTAVDGESGDNYGRSVALSGSHAIIGAYGDDDKATNAGAAWIHNFSSGQAVKITAADGSQDDYFGEFVSIYGNMAIIGAKEDDDKASNAGAAYVYQSDAAGSWTQLRKIKANDGAAGDYFGSSVAISGSYALVGAERADALGPDSGAAYIINCGAGASWAQQKLTPPNGESSDYFGSSVSISGDYAIVGAKWDDVNGILDSGAAYIYKRNRVDDVWEYETKLSGEVSGEKFGTSVQIEVDAAGNIHAIAGATGGAGAAYIYERVNGVWTLESKLTASDGATGDLFGCSVSISGQSAVIGAYGAGAAYFFKYDDTSGAWTEETPKLTAGDGSVGINFGRSVAISGFNTIVGANGYDYSKGAVYTYDIVALNTSLTIYNLSSLTTLKNESVSGNFMIYDPTPGGMLSVTMLSWESTDLSEGTVSFGGTDLERTVTVTPPLNERGTAKITIEVSDTADGETATGSFLLTVTDPPSISDIPDQTVYDWEADKTKTVGFTISDADTPADSISVTAFSSNTTLVPNSNISIAYTGGSPNYEITLTPVEGQLGIAEITVTATDSDNDTASAMFNFMVSAGPVFESITPSDISRQEDDQTAEVITVTMSSVVGSQITVSASSSNTSLIPNGNINIDGSGSNSNVAVPCSTTCSFDITVAPPLENLNGDATITVAVTDDSNKTSYGQISISVVPLTDPPVINSIVTTPGMVSGEVTIDEGQSVTGVLNITDVDGDTSVDGGSNLTVTVSSSNTNLVPNSSSNIKINGSSSPYTVTSLVNNSTDLNLSIIPLVDDYGTADITVTVSDGTRQDTMTFTLIVNELNDPPEIVGTIPETINAEEDQQDPVTLSFTLKDVEGGVLTLTATSDNSSLMPDSNIDINGLGNTATFTVDPNVESEPITLTMTLPPDANSEDFGDAAITLTAQDDSGDATTDTTVKTTLLTVAAMYDAPTIVSIPDAIGSESMIEDTPKDFALNVGSADGNNITIGVSSNNTALIANTTSCIKVNGYGTPYTVPPSEYEAGPLTLTLKPLLNAHSDEFGEATITVTADDGIASTPTKETFIVRVSPANDAPTVGQILDQSTPEDTLKSVGFTIDDMDGGALEVSVTSSDETIVASSAIKVNGYALPYTFQETDYDGKTLTMGLNPLPDAYGETTIEVTVSDGSLQGSVGFTLTVTPENDEPIVSAVSSQSMNEDGPAKEIGFTLEDPDGDLVALTVTSSNTALVPNEYPNIKVDGFQSPHYVDTSSGSASLNLSLKPLLNAYGTAIITISADDGNGGVDNEDFLLTVNPLNDAPTIEPIPDVNFPDDATYVDVSVKVSDVDGDTLTVTGSSGNATLLPNTDMNIDLNGEGMSSSVDTVQGSPSQVTIRLTPDLTQWGVATITVTVNDGTASDAFKTFDLYVDYTTQDLIISEIVDQTMDENSTMTLTFTIDGATTPTVSVTSSNPMLLPAPVHTDMGSGLHSLYLEPASNQYGTSTVTVKAEEGSKSDTESFVVTVESLNNPPAIQIYGDLNKFTESGTAIDVKFRIFDMETLAENLIVSFESSDTALVPLANIEKLGLSNSSPDGHEADLDVRITPAQDLYGELTIKAIVKDDRSETASVTFNLVVEEEQNEPPVIGGVMYVQDKIITTQAETITDGVSITGESGKVIQINAGDMVRVDAGEAVVVDTSTSIPVDAGQTITVYESAELIVSEIEINENGQTNEIEIWLSDVDADDLTVTVSSTEGSTLVPNDSDHINMDGFGNVRTVTSTKYQASPLILRITPATDQNGTETITVSVQDSFGNPVVEASFLLTVAPSSGLNIVPKIESIVLVQPDPDPPVSIVGEVVEIVENQQSGEIQIALSDGDDDVLAVEITSDNTSLVASPVLSEQIPPSVYQFEPVSLKITPVENTTGFATITVTVEDDNAAVAQKVFYVRVIPTDAPKIRFDDAVNPDNLSMDEDGELKVKFYVSDYDGDPVILSAESLASVLIPNAECLTIVDKNGASLVNNTVYPTPGVEVPLYLVITPAADENGAAQIILHAVEDKLDPNPETLAYASLTVNPMPDRLNIDVAFASADDPDGDGSPTILEDGTLSVTVTVTNPDMEPEGDNVTLAVSSQNAQLVPNDVNNIHINGEGFPYAFTLTNNSSGSRTLTIIPAFNANSALLDAARIKIDATNLNGTSTEYFTMTVDPTPDLPKISASTPIEGYWTINEGNTTDTIPFTVSDPDGQEMTVTVISADNVELSRPLLLPDGVAHVDILGVANDKVTPLWNSPSQLDLLVTPPTDANSEKSGKGEIVVRAESGGDVVEETFVLYVAPIPDNPEILGIYYNMSIVTKESTSVQFSTYQPEPIDFRIRDVDWGVVTISATSSNQSLVPNDGIHIFRRGELPGIDSSYQLPIDNDDPVPMDMLIEPVDFKTGVVKITITAVSDDGRQANSKAFYLEITNENDAPVINNIGNPLSMDEDTTLTVNFSVNDMDGDELNVSVFSDTQAIVRDADIKVGATGTNMISVDTDPGVDYPLSFKLKPILNANTEVSGPITITVRVDEKVTDTHPTSLTAQSSFELTINPINDDPTISQITDKQMNEDTQSVLDFSVGDIDEDVLIISAKSNNQQLITDASLVVSDTNGRVYYEGGLAKVVPTPGSVFPNTPLKLALKPRPNANSSLYGPVTVTLRIADAAGAFVEKAFLVTVVDQSDPPTIDQVEDVFMNEDNSPPMSPPAVPVVIYFEDKDGDLLNVTVESDKPAILPNDTAHLRFSGASVGANINNADGYVSTTVQTDPTAKVAVNLEITPVENMNTSSSGPVLLEIWANDGQNTFGMSFNLTIISQNDVPTISYITSPKFTQKDTILTVDFRVEDVETHYTNLLVFGESSDQTVIEDVDIVETPLTDTGLINYRMEITPVFGITGTATITVTVKDELGAKALMDGAAPAFDVIIEPEGEVPEIAPFQEPVYYTNEDTQKTMNFSIRYNTPTTPPALDIVLMSSNEALVPNGTNITYSWVSSTADGSGSYIHNYTMTIIPATDAPAAGQSNQTLITVSASAGTVGVDYTDEESFTLQVNRVNDSPVLSGIPASVMTNKNMPVSITFRAFDNETTADQLDFTFSSSNPALFPVGNIVEQYLGEVTLNYRVTMTPAKDQSGGPANITITVNDGSGAANSTANQVVQVTVGNVMAGDINTDDAVNLTDVILALQIAAGIPVTNVSLIADINGDGHISVPEAIYAMQYAAGLR